MVLAERKVVDVNFDLFGAVVDEGDGISLLSRIVFRKVWHPFVVRVRPFKCGIR